MLIPADVNIQSTVRSGSVFLFNEDSFNCNKNHYFIVLNHQPLSDELLLLVWAKTLSEKVFLHMESGNLPYATFIDITNKHSWSKKPTVIDCNNVIEKSINLLVDKLKKNNSKLIDQVDNKILVKLRKAVIMSPLVERHIKKKLRV